MYKKIKYIILMISPYRKDKYEEKKKRHKIYIKIKDNMQVDENDLMKVD